MKRRKMDMAKKINDEQFRVDHQKSLDAENWDQVFGQLINLKDCRKHRMELSFRDLFSKDAKLNQEMARKKPYLIF